MGIKKRRRVIALATVALFVGTFVVTWRLTSLDGLPDVGDPFDVAEFADATIPDDRNAYTLYRQATKLLTRAPDSATYDWSTAGEAEKRWLEKNHEALDVWRRGSERPDALYIQPRVLKFDTMLPVIQELRQFARAAGLEASRREAGGDMDGALTWYVAVLRSGRHCGTRGVTIERLVGVAINQVAWGHLSRWAADPRVDAAMLRRAIGAALDADRLTRPVSDVYKSEYIMLINSIDDPKMMTAEVFNFATGQDRSKAPDSGLRKMMREDVPKVLKREADRSRRVARLIYANKLAYCDLPADKQPPVAATLPPDHVAPAMATNPRPPAPGTVTTLVGELFAVESSAPAAARALPPAEIARWWDSTLYAKACMTAFANFPKAIARDQASRAALLALLRSEIEKREHPTAVGAKSDDRP